MPKVALEHVQLNYTFINNNAETDDVLVFLHEALGSIGQWKDFPHILCKRLGVKGLVYERQGHGLSSAFNTERKKDYLHRYAINELPKLLEALGIHTPVTLIGHSDGASIALIFAAHYPKKTKAIVSMAAHVFVEEVTLKGIEPIKKIYQTKIREKLKRYHPNNVDELFYAWANTWLSKDFLNWNIVALLPNISSPVLALQGAEDEYGTIKQLHAIKENCSGKVQLNELENCKHIPFIQQKELTLNLICDFLGHS